MEDGGRGESVEKMQRLKWVGVMDRTLKYDGIIRQRREGTTVKESDKYRRRGEKCLPL